MSGDKGWWSSTGGAMFGASSTTAKGFTSKVGSMASGVGNQVKSMGSTVTSAFGKTKNAVVGAFTPGTSETPKDDPTSLANIPKTLGPELYVANGQLYESRGDHTKALENYTKALESEPKNVPALVSTARLYDRQGQADRASEFYRKALAVNPNDASIYNDLGLAYQKSGNVAAARENLAKAASMDASNARYKNNLATLLVEQGQPDEAISQLKQVFPPAVAHYNVAYMHFSKQNLPAAQQQLQMALQADPNLKEARDLYARLGGSQAVAQATNAYQLAGNIYQTVQGVGQPQVSQPANVQPVTAQMPVSNTLPVPNGMPAPGVPSGTTNQPAWMNAPALPSFPVQ